MRETRAAYLSLVVEPNDDGYLAQCPGIQGAFAEGESLERRSSTAWTSSR